MKVRQVIQLAAKWVELYGSQTPGFCGAHLTGGINTMPPDARFPLYRDVDLIMVLQEGGKSTEENLELAYEGLILECGFKGLEEYRSPERVLANPHVAHDFATDSILSDPTGLLAETQDVITREFARRRWVLARCDYEKQRALGHLEELGRADSPFAALTQLWRFVEFLAGSIAVANLKPPTHRKCLVLMKELLQERDRLDLHEEMLSVLGCAHMDREKVEFYLEECATAFDRAVAVRQTPSFWGFKLRPHVRPYAIKGAQEIIDGGNHREAMWWIVFFLVVSLIAIQTDAPDEGKPRFRATFGRLLNDLGLGTPADWQSRLRQGRKLTEGVFRVVDDIIESLIDGYVVSPGGG
jgi:hypothetical protein